MGRKESNQTKQTNKQNSQKPGKSQGILTWMLSGNPIYFCTTGPTELHSAVGNESDCISRGPELDPGPVPYFHGD